MYGFGWNVMITAGAMRPGEDAPVAWEAFKATLDQRCG
jgi:hypothetical protein